MRVHSFVPQAAIEQRIEHPYVVEESLPRGRCCFILVCGLSVVKPVGSAAGTKPNKPFVMCKGVPSQFVSELLRRAWRTPGGFAAFHHQSAAQCLPELADHPCPMSIATEQQAHTVEPRHQVGIKTAHNTRLHKRELVKAAPPMEVQFLAGSLRRHE